VDEEMKVEKLKIGIIFNIIIPLIVGIIITSSLSVIIITILSPYWAQQGGILSEGQQVQA
jgi:hypothetical protein